MKEEAKKEQLRLKKEKENQSTNFMSVVSRLGIQLKSPQTAQTLLA